jgi:hypothetical protein
MVPYHVKENLKNLTLLFLKSRQNSSGNPETFYGNLLWTVGIISCGHWSDFPKPVICVLICEDDMSLSLKNILIFYGIKAGSASIPGVLTVF